MIPSRFLIINADDLGISPEVNRGIFTAYEKGIVTDSSLLIQGPSAQEAIDIIKKDPAFRVGIHIDLDPLLGWRSPGKERYPRRKLLTMMNEAEFASKVKKEIQEQTKAFLDTGLIPSHIDTHHHVHGFPRIFEILLEVMNTDGIGVIRFSKKGYSLLEREGIPLTTETAQWMEKMLQERKILYPHYLFDPLTSFSLKGLPGGVSELMVHPSFGGDPWRKKDYEMLMNPHFMDTIRENKIELMSYAELKSSLSSLT
jgi:predicted glycoside hydrolase/deacetylase ChbG (UPF0249 family)